MSAECETCAGSGWIEYGEFGGDCAAIHGMGGRMPEAPGRSICDDCGGTGRTPATHTKGPWEAKRWDDDAAGIGGWTFSAGGYLLPLVDMETDDPAEAEANARLIAAAPEMLKALQDIDQRLRTCMTAPGMSMISVADAYDSFYQDIVAQAIARATAQQPDPTR